MASLDVIKCRAAVAWGPNQPLVMEEIQVDPLQAHEVRIRIVAASLCHTDLAFLGREKGLFPRIFGHEAAGIVESVGERVKGVKEGDHVVPVFVGECGHCKSPKTNLCQKYWPLIKATGMLQPLHEKTRTWCGLERCKGRKRISVAIFGLGTIGLAVADGARIAGASKINGVDINPNKFVVAKQFGVTEFVNPNDYDKPIQQVLQEITNGGVDYSFECVGKSNLMTTALESTCEGWGKTLILGVDTSGKQLCVHPYLLTGRSIECSLFGGFKGKTQVPHLVDRFLRKEIMVEKYITHEIPFDGINEAIELLKEGKSLRCIMHMSPYE